MNFSGSIEGLPLQLMIIGLVASLGTAVIVGWISSIEIPRYVDLVEIEPEEILIEDFDGDGIYEKKLDMISLRVFDTSGNIVQGARIFLEGEVINNRHHRLYGTTDSDGRLVFYDVEIMTEDSRVNAISIMVNGQGIANEFKTEILVMSE